ncbi:hypothetical protein GCM10009801_19160 [Streptomyces albiaxialis]|uniref:Uncharacterized protein n=1 Tax=Streptomyces albiaxialis TaxID=329523 RepID=A0ABN2VRP4_9ACTN
MPDKDIERCVKRLTDGSVHAVTANDTSLAYAATLEPSTFAPAGLGTAAHRGARVGRRHG